MPSLWVCCLGALSLAAVGCKPAPSGASGAGTSKPGAQAIAAASPKEATFSHATVAMSFVYPSGMAVASKPDGATLTSPVLGQLEDPSGVGPPTDAVFIIEVSIRAGKLLDVMAANPTLDLRTLFPSGKENSFKEQKGFAAAQKVAGAIGYRVTFGAHAALTDLTYAAAPSGTLEVACRYLDVKDAKIPLDEQRKACDRVLSTLSL